MAEVVGLLASIGQLTGYILTTCDYIDKIKNATPEKAAMGREVALLFTLLMRLQQRVETASQKNTVHIAWLKNVRRLCPALDELKSDLDDLVTKTSRNRFLWPWDGAKCQKILDRIERLKSAIQMEMQESLTDLVDQKLNIIAQDTRSLRESQEGVWWEKARQWFSSAGSPATQQAVFEKSHPGTGNWLLQHPKFLDWIDDRGEVLWCHGIPGAGKTIMASIIVNHLKEMYEDDASICTLCVYFSYKEARDHIEILNDIYLQLLRRHQSFPDRPKFLIEDWQRKDSRPTVLDLEDLIKSELDSYSAVFLVVDAFDECASLSKRDELDEGQDGFRRKVYESLQSFAPCMSLLITSRVSGDLPRLFENAAQPEIEGHKEDMRAYIEQRINDGGGRYRWTKMCSHDPSFRTDAVNTIIKKAEKMFLLVRLHVDALHSRNKVTDVHKALRSLPTKLYDTYDQAMTRIHAQSETEKCRAEKILMWITYGLRPFTISELQHAEAISVGEFDLDERDIEDADSLVSCCAGLVTVDSMSQAVRFVHYTTQEYFQDCRQKHFPDGDRDIAKVCLTYLQLEDLEDDRKELTRDELLRRYPLIGYSTCYWGIHANRDVVHARPVSASVVDQETFALAFSLLKKKSRTSDKFYAMPRDEDMSSIPSPRRPEWQLSNKPSGSHIAAGFGLNSVLEAILDTGGDPNLQDGRGYTPLHRAALHGRYDTVCLLLDRGASIDRRSRCNSLTPLICATATGRTEIARLLLEQGADVNAICSKSLENSTALFEACWMGYVDVVQLLLEHKAECVLRLDQITRYFNGRWPMSAAAGYGENRIIELLVVGGVSLDGLKGYLAMQEALRARRLETLRLLVDRGADITFAPDGQRTIMDIACGTGSWAIVQYLVQQQLGFGTSENVVEDKVAKEFANLPWFVQTRVLQAEQKETDASISIVRFRRDDACHYDLSSDPVTYMGFFVPQGVVNVQKVIFRVEAHDQATPCHPIPTDKVDGTHPDHPGLLSLGAFNQSEAGSFTFFEASVENRSHSGHCLQRRIFHNEQQDAERQLKICEWTRDDEDQVIANYIKRLSPGHVLQVRPKTRHVKRVNHVKSCEVEIHYLNNIVEEDAPRSDIVELDNISSEDEDIAEYDYRMNQVATECTTFYSDAGGGTADVNLGRRARSYLDISSDDFCI